MTRRGRTIATLVVLGALVLAGCGSSYHAPGTGSQSPTTPATTPAPTTAPPRAGSGYAGY